MIKGRYRVVFDLESLKKSVCLVQKIIETSFLPTECLVIWTQIFIAFLFGYLLGRQRLNEGTCYKKGIAALGALNGSKCLKK